MRDADAAGEAQVGVLHVPLLARSAWGPLARRGLVGGKLGREMFCAVFI